MRRKWKFLFYFKMGNVTTNENMSVALFFIYFCMYEMFHDVFVNNNQIQFFLRFFFKDGWGGLNREHELVSLEVVRHGDIPGV